MLDFYWNSYNECADAIEDWRDLSVSELINLYENNEYKDKNIANAAISAVILKYWKLAMYYYRTYNNYYKGSFAPEDFYDLIVLAVMKALEKRVWKNPESSLYLEPDGPERAIKVIFNTERVKFMKNINNKSTYKDFKSESIDRIFEGEDDDAKTYAAFFANKFLSYTHTFNEDHTQALRSKIKQLCGNKNKLLSGIILYNILYNDNIFVDISTLKKHKNELTAYKFSRYNLTSALKSATDDQIKLFADEFNCDFMDIKELFNKIFKYTNQGIVNRVDKAIKLLYNDKEIKEILGVE